ncbi:MAG: GDSL-type esterase/lipase family protein [Candidatus Neomarinimicrobiota bacterium]
MAKLFAPLVFFLLMGCELKNDLYPKEGITFPNQAQWQIDAYHKRINEFKQNPIGYKKIVFLGNSITEGGGDWNDRFNISNAVNRGISGDFTVSMQARLEEIYHYKPLKLFLLIGINDIFDGVVPYEAEETPKKIAQNIFDIVDSIRYHSLETEIFIQTILPVNEEEFRMNRGFYPEHDYPLEKQILEINHQILKLGANKNYNIIDLHRSFVNEKGEMDKNFAKDGLHLNEKGYANWCTQIENFVKN